MRQRELSVWVACSLLLSVTSSSGELLAQESYAHYRFEDSDIDLIDDVTGDVHGSIDAPAVGSPNAPELVGLTNDVSIDFTGGGGISVNGIGFVFHDVAAGGIEGDATLEWFFLAPGPTAPGHSSFFWTGPDSSRYNIFWGATFTGAPDSDRFVSGDFFNEDNVPISSNGHNTQFPLTLDEWHHVAMVRTALGAPEDPDYRWEWYFDGVLNDLQTVETFAPLPTAANWTINGRGGFNFPGFMDEIRMTEGALDPEDFLGFANCPAEGDTHCQTLTVDGPPGNTPGDYTATATAVDDSGDGIIYTFTADNGVDAPTVMTETENTATFFLTEAEWTITASVDDSGRCVDAAADRTCDAVVITVAGDVPPTIAYYRFEEGGGIDVIDEDSGDSHGTINAAVHSADTPELEGGPPNDVCIEFVGDGGITMDGAGFVFHDVTAGGAPGDATLEWLFLAPGPTAPGHSSFFWGRDSSRYNIFWGADFTGAPDSDRFVSGDFFNGGNTPISSNGHNTQFPLTLDEWHHVAIVRTALGAVGGSDYLWEWYFDGVLNDVQTVETFAPLPTAANWTINGRGAPFTFPGLMDEVRMSRKALDQGDFITILREGCPPEGDTHCQGLSVNGPPGNTPGQYTVSVTAVDDNAETISYTITADNGIDAPKVESGPENTATFFLLNGNWTISASVDDSDRCVDAAADMTCDAMVLNVEGELPETIAYYRFEEGGGIDVIDEESGDSHGTINAAVHSTDTPELDGGPPNDFCIEFVGDGGITMNGAGFVFHDVTAGGAPGDATLEWLFLAPGPTAPGHSSFFWGRDSSRYNIFWGADFTGAPDSDRFVSGDFFNGSNTPISSDGHNTQFPLTLGEWHHVAIVRTALGAVGGSDYLWEWYFDGVLNDLQTVETFAPLPTAANWTINGRGAPFTFPGLMDEVRASFRALDPEDMLSIESAECPTEGDTHCTGMTADGPSDGGDNLAGTYTLRATAVDDAIDRATESLFFRFTAENEFGDMQSSGRIETPQAGFFLAPGVWDLRVEVDDDLGCTDVANDAVCEILGFEVSDEFAPPDFYFRFEEDERSPDIVDSISGNAFGSVVAGAIRSTETPFDTVPQTNASNGFSLDFAGGGDVLIDNSTFIFHDAAVGGAPGDATLEWFFLTPGPVSPAHSSFFWTGLDDSRYNIFWNASFEGTVDSDRFVSADFFKLSNVPVVASHNTGAPFTLDEWHHIAIVRTSLGGDDFRWEWYHDGALHAPNTVETIGQPMPDSAEIWTINGRGGFHFPGFMDEVRGVSRALTPGEFLMSPGGQGVGPFVRGDCDNNGSVGGSPTEAIVLLNFAFRGAAAPPCLAACDAEANGAIGVTDALRILRFAFLGIGVPDAPFPDCVTSALGTDVELGCENPRCAL